MRIQASELVKLKSQFLKFIIGSTEVSCLKPLPPEHQISEHLVYVSKADQLQKAVTEGAPIIIALDKLPLDKVEITNKQCLFSTPSITATMSIVNSLFDTKLNRWHQQIHPTAIIGDNVKLGKNVRIGPLTTVECGAEIGDNTILHSQVFIGENCKIGKNCEVHPHTSIGSDGFGYVTDPTTLEHHKIPQLGIVVIEDFVEIGSNCAIDRATLHETRICKGTKLDNLVHIAHNCTIGENSLLAAGFMIAGSSVLGKNFKCGGGAVVGDHVTICDNVTLGGRAVVVNDIKEPGVYLGYPIEPIKDGLRTLASLPKVPELRKHVNKILKHLNLEE